MLDFEAADAYNVFCQSARGLRASMLADGCGSSSVGRAPPCHGGGREFESRLPLQYAEVAQLVEHHLAMVGVASSSLVFRSIFDCKHHRNVLGL